MKFKNRNEFFNENGHLNETGLAVFVEALAKNALETLTENMSEHVEECIECKKKILLINEVTDQVEKLKNDSLPAQGGHDKSKKFIRLFLRVASIILIGLGVGSALYYFISNPKNKRGSVNITQISDSNIVKKQSIFAQKDSISSGLPQTGKNKKTILREEKGAGFIAENFKESAFFENLISSNYRSNDIEIEEPAIGQRFYANDSILFRIKGEITEPLSIKLYDNKEKLIVNFENITSDNYFVNKELSPGLYYWKVLEDDDLVKVGKIEVKY